MSDGLTRIAQFFTATQTVLAVCGAILAFGIWAAFHVIRGCRIIRRELAKANATLRQVSSPQDFTRSFSALNSELSAHRLVGPEWVRFSAALLPAHRSVAFLRTPTDPHVFFGLDAVSGRVLNLRLVQAVPSYLTGAGIFFTFAGLVAGIHVASQGLASTDMAAKLEALHPLLRGAGLAFGTSMAGLFGSIGVSWLEKAQFNRVAQDLESWNRSVHALVPYVSAEKLAAEQLLEQEKQTTQLERFNTDLAVSIATALDARIADRVVPVLDKMATSLDAINEKQSKIGEQVISQVGDTIADAVKGATGKEAEAMRLALTQITEALNAASESIKTHQQSGQANLEKVLASVSALVGHVEGVVTRLVDLGAALSETLPEISDANIALKATAEPLRGLAGELTGVAAQVGSQVEAIQSAASTIDAASQNLKGMQTGLESAWGNYEKRFADVDRALGASLDQITKGCDLYAEKIRELNQGLDKHFGKALSDLAGAIAGLDEAIDDFQQGQGGGPRK